MPCDPPLDDYRGIGKTSDFGHFCRFRGLTHDLWSREDFDAT